MRNKTFFFLFLTCLSLLLTTAVTEAQESCVKIAKITYRNIEDALRERVLTRPEHKELYNNYQESEKLAKKQDEARMGKILEAQKEGKLTIDMKDMLGNENVTNTFMLKRKVEELTKDEFRKIVATSFADSYDIIIEEKYDTEVLYSKCPIQDITSLFRQHLLTSKR